jgi:DNA-directed RNA polymerase sigma subunit (sigma70/sigma32)
MESIVDMQHWSTEQNWQYPDIDKDDALAIASHQYTDSELVDEETLEVLADKHFFETLTPMEHALISKRFGMHGEKSSSLKDIAKAIQLPYAQVKESYGTAMAKLRKKLS